MSGRCDGAEMGMEELISKVTESVYVDTSLCVCVCVCVVGVLVVCVVVCVCVCVGVGLWVCGGWCVACFFRCLCGCVCVCVCVCVCMEGHELFPTSSWSNLFVLIISFLKVDRNITHRWL